MTTTSLADAKNRLSEIIASAERTHERTVVTKNGKPVAVVLSIEDFQGMQETLEILSDPAVRAELEEGIAEADRGEFVSDEEMREFLASRRIPPPAQLQQ
jgi:antitoxin YefM